jgi:hypothetical protein
MKKALIQSGPISLLAYWDKPKLYFGRRLHWLGRLPLNWKFAPTTIG